MDHVNKRSIMNIKRIVKRHAGAIIAVFSILAMFPLAALMCLFDDQMGLTESDGDGPGPLFAMQVTVFSFLIGIVIELVNPFEGKRKDAERI